jgi:hypothetical protein
MARATMNALIEVLRGFTNAGTADYTIAGIDYFSNDHLEAILDRRCTELREVAMTAHELRSVYKDYSIPSGWLETSDGGTARFIVEEVDGTDIAGTLYTVDYENGKVTFVNDQAGSARYVTARSYDIYGAAADVWRQKANQYATMIDFSTDNHNIKRSHIVAQCEMMAKRYQAMAISGDIGSADMVRGDRAI